MAFRSAPGSPSQVPAEWIGSGSDLLSAAMRLHDEHEGKKDVAVHGNTDA